VRRLGPLKTRFELVLAGTTGALLVLMAATLVFVRYRDQRRLLENNAGMFAQTTNSQICQQYQTYYHSGSYKFREIVRRMMTLNPDVRRILILSVTGEVLYDSSESPNYNLEPDHAARRLADRAIASHAAELAPREFRRRDPKLGPLLLVLAPYMEDWGRHPYSVLYVFTYDSLFRTMRAMAPPIAGLLLLSFAVVAAVARWLSGRIARPIEVLTANVREFEAGRSRAPLELSAPDEIEELAETFGRMATRLEEHVQRLERANEELKALDRLKTDLLANVSHELRTPLSAVRGYVEFMGDGHLGAVNEQQSKALSICLRNIDRLNRNINLLLDFSRLELGHVALNVAPISLESLIRQIASAFEADAGRKGITLAVDAPDELPPVLGDRDRLTQVFENLLSNALKFTPAGGRIGIAARPAPDGRSVEVTVADTGIGIAPDDRERIFQKFYQVEGGASRRFGGVGLGLAIVKSILDAHRVPIRVEGRPGGGTAFRFALPCASARSTPWPGALRPTPPALDERS
jgi:signal transduction histidine kinase